MADGNAIPLPFIIPWDSFADHFARGSLTSNFDAMCRTSAYGQHDLRRECRRCNGLGYRVLPEEIVAGYEWRISHAKNDKARQDLRDQLSRESKCGPCRGVGSVSQRPKTRGKRQQNEAKRMDSLYTTVLCKKCRGFDARNELKDKDGERLLAELMGRHWGTSSGEARIYGTTPLNDPEVPGLVRFDPRDDAAAEVEDRCDGCGGRSYVVPITVRPSLRTSDAENRGEDESARAGYFESDSSPDEDIVARAADWLDERDEECSLGLRVLAGEHGQQWADHDWGRTFALWPLDPAGQKLAEGSRGQSAEIERFSRDLALIRFERERYLSGDVDPRRQALIYQTDVASIRFERRVVRAVLRACEAVS